MTQDPISESSWEHFIRSRYPGVVVDDAAPRRLEASFALHRPALLNLASLGVLRARGEDCRTFLRGQFTSELNRVTPEQGAFAGYCTPKGRLVALLSVVLHHDQWWLVAPRSLLESLRQRLERYILRADVRLSFEPDTDVVLGYCAADDFPAETSSPSQDDAASPDPLGDRFGPLPARAWATGEVAGMALQRLFGPRPRYLLVGPKAMAQTLWQQCAGHLQTGHDAAWSYFNVQAGLPTICPETVERFVPQMVNLEQVGGLDFDKGCYPGQEVVARTQYLGRLKRRMVRLRSAQAVPLRPGDRLTTRRGDENTAGTVVEAVMTPQGTELLAVVDLAAWQVPLCPADTDILLNRQPLPYPLPDIPSGE